MRGSAIVPTQRPISSTSPRIDRTTFGRPRDGTTTPTATAFIADLRRHLCEVGWCVLSRRADLFHAEPSFHFFGSQPEAKRLMTSQTHPTSIRSVDVPWNSENEELKYQGVLGIGQVQRLPLISASHTQWKNRLCAAMLSAGLDSQGNTNRAHRATEDASFESARYDRATTARGRWQDGIAAQ